MMGAKRHLTSHISVRLPSGRLRCQHPANVEYMDPGASRGFSDDLDKRRPNAPHHTGRRLRLVAKQHIYMLALVEFWRPVLHGRLPHNARSDCRSACRLAASFFCLCQVCAWITRVCVIL